MPNGYLANINESALAIRSMNGKAPKRYGGLQFVGIEDVTLQQPEWLWDEMIAKGQFHVMAGESGIGKTQLLCNISAIISRGGIFPNMKYPCEKGMVVYLSGEDDLNTTIGPRFMACGGNEANFKQLKASTEDNEPICLIDVLDNLTEFVFDHDVKLIIIDPITCFMQEGFDNNSVTSVRRMATRLKGFCETTGVAIIALNHLTKGNLGSPMHRILGSGAWVHGPRVVMGATVHEDRYLFGKWKANITVEEGVYEYEMVHKEIQDMDGSVTCIDWTDNVMPDRKLKEFCELAPSGRGERGELTLEVLREELANGYWHRSKELVERVRRETGMSERQIRRLALETLKVETRIEEGVHGYTSWRLEPMT